MPQSFGDNQNAVFEFLQNPRTHGLREPVTRIDTHGAAVFLAGPDVYKVKRALRFPFMDFSTLERRRAACEAEIAVNRHNAPFLYRGVIPITRDGQYLQLAGEGEVVEWAVHMRRFDENATLDHLADRGVLGPPLIEKLASAIAASHRRAPCKDGDAATRVLHRLLRETANELAGFPNLFPTEQRRPYALMLEEAFDAIEPLLLRRGALIHPALPWRSPLRQHRSHRRRANPLRCDRVRRGDRDDRYFIRSRVFFDGPMGARSLRRRKQAPQPLSREMRGQAPAAGRLGGAAAIHEYARGNSGEDHCRPCSDRRVEGAGCARGSGLFRSGDEIFKAGFNTAHCYRWTIREREEHPRGGACALPRPRTGSTPLAKRFRAEAAPRGPGNNATPACRLRAGDHPSDLFQASKPCGGRLARRPGRNSGCDISTCGGAASDKSARRPPPNAVSGNLVR